MATRVSINEYDIINAHKTVTASDSVELPRGSVKLYVGTTGNVTIQDFHGNSAAFTTIPAGTTLDIRGARYLMATGTTASNFVVSYKIGGRIAV